MLRHITSASVSILCSEHGRRPVERKQGMGVITLILNNCSCNVNRNIIFQLQCYSAIVKNMIFFSYEFLLKQHKYIFYGGAD